MRKADSARCLNCGAPLAGPFCGACGQKALPLDLTLRDFLDELAHEMLHLDGKIFQSVKKLLLSPGFLTREHFEGRRARWVSPIRLYLLFSVLYFAVGAISPSSPIDIRFTGDNPQETSAQLQRIGFANEGELREAVNHAWATWTPRVMFLLVPLFAWLVALAFRRSHYTYLQHLFFALHTHAAWFAAAAVGEAAKLPSPWVIDKGIQALLIGFCVTYTVLAVRRANRTTTRQAAKRTAFIMPVYGVAVMVTVLVITLPVIFGRLWHSQLAQVGTKP